MLRLQIFDRDRDPEILFAECELDTISRKGTWIYGPIKMHRLCFGDDNNIPVKKRKFSVKLCGHAIVDFDGASHFDLLMGGSDADVTGKAKFPRQANINGRIDGVFYSKKKQDIELELAKGLMFDSVLVLQWESADKVKNIKLPICIEASEEDITRYEIMRKDLSQRGLFSFVYDELCGVFAQNRITLSWERGKSSFSGSDAEIEKRAVEQIWNLFFGRWIPAILEAPIWETTDINSIVPLSKVRRVSPSLTRRLSSRISPPRYVLSKQRAISFVVDAHVVIYSFLRRQVHRYKSLIEMSSKQLLQRFQDELKDEESGKYGEIHLPVVVQLKQKILDIQERLKGEEKKLEGMREDFRRLNGTEIFKGLSIQKSLSYYDVPPVEFSTSEVYRAIYDGIKQFDQQFFNWRSPARDRYRGAVPISSSDNNDLSLSAWKFSKMYQYWVYYQFCVAAIACNLKNMEKSFHSGEGSWVSFESEDGIQFKLYHEVKGAAKGILEEASLKAPLTADAWCASEWNGNDDYATPDFACVVSHNSFRSFLIMIDAKTNPVWVDKEHEKARKKYQRFRLLLPGYNGGERTPDKAITTQQSWIVYPTEGHFVEVDPKDGPWKFDGKRLIRAAGAFDEVCLGRLKGRCDGAQSNLPFQCFIKAQLAYCRTLINDQQIINSQPIP